MARLHRDAGDLPRPPAGARAHRGGRRLAGALGATARVGGRAPPAGGLGDGGERPAGRVAAALRGHPRATGHGGAGRLEHRRPVRLAGTGRRSPGRSPADPGRSRLLPARRPPGGQPGKGLAGRPAAADRVQRPGERARRRHRVVGLRAHGRGLHGAALRARERAGRPVGPAAAPSPRRGGGVVVRRPDRRGAHQRQRHRRRGGGGLAGPLGRPADRDDHAVRLRPRSREATPTSPSRTRRWTSSAT